MKFFRPPWGVLSKKTAEIIKKQYGYRMFNWNKDSLDYILPFSRKMHNTVLGTTKDPVIILFHDGIILSPIITRKHSIRTIEKLDQGTTISANL